MKLTQVSWIVFNMFPSTCLNHFAPSSNRTVPKPSSVPKDFHILQHLTKDFNAVRLKCRRKRRSCSGIFIDRNLKVVLNHNVQLDNVARYNKRLKRYINLQASNSTIQAFPQN